MFGPAQGTTVANVRRETYLVLTAVDGPALLNDMRFSAFFIIVFIRVSILLPILGFLSLGTDGPP